MAKETEASGVVGYAALKHFAELGDVTHLVYAALYEKPGLYAGWLEADQIQTNGRMLENLFEPLSRSSSRLRHVTLLQGTKAYGAHVRPIPLPARENRDELRDVANGDVFDWQSLWPAIADALGMEPGERKSDRLGETMPARATEWDAVREKYDLVSPGLRDFVGESFHYADFVMARGAEGGLPPAIVSTIKLRQAGFHDVMGTEKLFQKWVAMLQNAQLLPAI